MDFMTATEHHPDSAPWSDPGKAFFDIECVKVPATDGVHPFRFSTYMIGVVYLDAGVVTTRQFYGKNESRVLENFAVWCTESRIQELGFCATRNFDYEVLAGRWTSARKALAPTPRFNYPFLLWDKTLFAVTNFRKEWEHLPRAERTDDVSGKDCMREWTRNDPAGVAKCLRHNLLDLLEMADLAAMRQAELDELGSIAPTDSQL